MLSRFGLQVKMAEFSHSGSMIVTGGYLDLGLIVII